MFRQIGRKDHTSPEHHAVLPITLIQILMVETQEPQVQVVIHQPQKRHAERNENDYEYDFENTPLESILNYIITIFLTTFTISSGSSITCTISVSPGEIMPRPSNCAFIQSSSPDQ